MVTPEGGVNVCKGLAEIEKKSELNGQKKMAVNLYKSNPLLSIEDLANAAYTTVDVVKSWILEAGLQLR